MFQPENKPKGISPAGYSAKKKLYHISDEDHNGDTFEPRLPVNFMTNADYEDSTTPRVCFSTSIDGCLIGTMYKTDTQIMYVHEPADYSKLSTRKPSTDEVPEAEISDEVWVLSPVKLNCIGKIKVIKPIGTPLLYTYGDDQVGEAFQWQWEYIKD